MNKHDSTGAAFPRLSKKTIESQLDTTVFGKTLTVFETVDSTNEAAKRQLSNGVVNGAVFLSDEQTAGKGRLGRTWSSSKGKAIAMSLILAPTPAFEKPYLLTQLTAAALSEALQPWTDTAIKWPNDVLVDNKKIAGILTETQFSGSTMEAVIIGIGINANQEQDDFPEDILQKATSLQLALDAPVDPNQLVAAFLSKFEALYLEYTQTHNPDAFLKVCRKRSALLGKKVWVLRNGQTRKAFVQGIGDEGELHVLYEGEIEEERLYSGEVSIRGLDGYV